jgi:hypothetical protein
MVVDGVLEGVFSKWNRRRKPKEKGVSLSKLGALDGQHRKGYHFLDQLDACCWWLQGRNSLECAAPCVVRSKSNKMNVNKLEQ